MKLKKSDAGSRRDKKHLSSQGQSLLFEAEEDARGLLTGELVPEAADASVAPSNKGSNNKHKPHKRTNWRGVLGFGGGGRGSSSSNAAAASLQVGDNKKKKNGESKKKEKKQKERKPSGYTLSITPKHMRSSSNNNNKQEQSSSSAPYRMAGKSKTTPRRTTHPSAKETTNNATAKKTTQSRVKPKPESVPMAKPTTTKAARSPVVTESKERETKSAAAMSSPGFEVTYQHNINNMDQDADASRLTATTVSSSSCLTTTSGSKTAPPQRNGSKSPKVKTTTILSPKQKQRSSPVARAAALALVKGKSGDEYDDFGEHDFDPNEDDSSLEEGDETDMTSSAGPLSSQDGSNSAFSFNLAAGNFKSGSRSINSRPDEDDGFEILSKRSKSSKLGSPKMMSATQTLPTVCSTRSSMSKQSPSSLSPSSGSQFSPRLSASGSMLSQHTSTSSSIFSLTMGASLSSNSRGGASLRESRSITTPSTPRSSRKSAPSKASPMSPVSTKKHQSLLVLARPFGRRSLPESAMPWAVQVSPAEWDNQERRWKYRVQVTHRQSAKKQPPTPSSNVAVTWRSLENFVWLEHALNTEFQGGLVLPLLSIAVGMTDLEQVTHEVDANLLRDWLNDVLNGIRGQGELIFHERSVDLLRSEAVEAFLYRNTAPLQKPSNLIVSLMGDVLLTKQQEIQDQHRRQQLQLRQRQQIEDEEEEERNCQNAMCKPSPRSRSSPASSSQYHPQEEQESFVASLIKAPLTLMTEELCVGMGCQVVEDSPSSAGSFVDSPVNKFGRYSSQALGSADTLDIQDSFIDASTIASMQSSPLVRESQRHSPSAGSLILAEANNKGTARTWKLAQSYGIIHAERDLVLSYRKNALSTMEKVQVLLEEEEHVGLAWKRFFLQISNLFSYEKEVENARLGDKKIHRDHMPYRKVKKSTVDQCLRTLAQHKVDRSVPSLRILRSMLTAYVADLSAVGPSVDAYLEGVSQMATFEDVFAVPIAKRSRPDMGEEKSNKGGALSTPSMSSHTSSEGGTTNTSGKNGTFNKWQEQLRAIARTSSQQLKTAKNFADIIQASSTSSTDSTDQDAQPAPATELQQKRVVEDRVLANELLLKEYLTTLCKSTSLRTARMAYTYFKSEASQCALLRADAGSLRTKIDLSDKEAVAKMIGRHQEENKEDTKTELALALRMVNLGNMKKFLPPGSPSNGIDETIEVDTDNQDADRAMAEMRDNALQIARERVGRWNSDLAMAIMKAVGVDDPNVRVEETTRELRLVRKYAIGLREHLNRCIEAVNALRNVVLKGRYNGRADIKGADTGKKPAKNIAETRKEYFTDLSTLFSGVFIAQEDGSPTAGKASKSAETLAKAGIKLNDPMGWSALAGTCSPKRMKANDEVKCGTAAKAYVELRDSQTEWLLSSLSGLLNDYAQRVEVVESFVYMECVGVQLEKYFSKKRTDALTAFEKKTDITSAINIATRKRIPGLVEELKAKLERFDVTHTSVKEAKEAHLESKSVKTELHALALRRLLRARETSTERVINLLQFWMKEEESICNSELNALGDTLDCLESSFLGALG